MKKIAQFNSQLQGHLMVQALLNSDIQAQLVGSREYSSIIVGLDESRYDLLVEPKDEELALQLLSEMKKSAKELWLFI